MEVWTSLSTIILKCLVDLGMRLVVQFCPYLGVLGRSHSLDMDDGAALAISD